jgi:hypothetical protein
MAKSLYERLPLSIQSRAMRRLSKRARGPGDPTTPKAYGGGAVGRSAGAWMSQAGLRGVVPIEVRPGALTADIAVWPQFPTAGITLDYGSGATPATGVHTDNSFRTVAYGASGLKVVTVTAPPELRGEVEFTV